MKADDIESQTPNFILLSSVPASDAAASHTDTTTELKLWRVTGSFSTRLDYIIYQVNLVIFKLCVLHYVVFELYKEGNSMVIYAHALKCSL